MNQDGLTDLVCHVDTENFDPGFLQVGDAYLTAQTSLGEAIEGYDEVTIVPPE